MYDLQNYIVPTLNGSNTPTIGTENLVSWVRSPLKLL